jgi:methyltransferase (TIGR00027 family)
MTHDISKTAIWVAAARAVGAREPDPAARNPDHLAEKLLGDAARLVLKHPMVDALGLTYEAAMQDFEVAGLVRSMTVRTRFIDEGLERAIAAGATQVLVLGAGLDSHAYRFRELLAPVRVFELDRPATLAFKRSRVEAAVGAPPANLVYVPVDLEQEEMAAGLARHGYDVSRRTFIIMEGVTMYVADEPLRATFRFISAHAAGSSIVFDFATQAMIDGFRNLDTATIPPAARPSVERFLDLVRDEPWVFGIPLDGEKDFLAGVGLDLREMLTIGGPESVARYLTRADGTVMGAEGTARAEAMRKAVIAKMVESMGTDQREMIEARMREQERQNAYRIAEAVVRN